MFSINIWLQPDGGHIWPLKKYPGLSSKFSQNSLREGAFFRLNTLLILPSQFRSKSTPLTTKISYDAVHITV